MKRVTFFLNGKERRVNHRDTGRCGRGRLLDRRQPLGSPKCAGTRPSPARRHDSGIIVKTSPSIKDELAPPVFALHPDAAENNEESESRTSVTKNTKFFLNYSTTNLVSYPSHLDTAKAVPL
ncbi:hypothetical protein Hanom_Chr09g00830671 [Helianthus anomalus]